VARADRLLFTCEHGGNRIPRAYAAHFAGATALLAGHRGYDPGALALARWLARRANAPLYAVTISRLLIDLNRSLGHPRLFSEVSAPLAGAAKDGLVARYYRPHREQVEAAIAGWVGAGERVLHVAVHSFTPVLAGQVRRADIGLLYDPARWAERELCARWAQRLREMAPELRVRRNYPYRGHADGFSTYLRTRFAPPRYLGIELEVNQACLATRPVGERLRAALAASLTGLTRPGMGVSVAAGGGPAG